MYIHILLCLLGIYSSSKITMEPPLFRKQLLFCFQNQRAFQCLEVTSPDVTSTSKTCHKMFHPIGHLA